LLINTPALAKTPSHASMLLQALERTRTILAIAIAAETKSTPPMLRQYYLETADSMHKCIKRLRMGIRNGVKDEGRWLRALVELGNLSHEEEKSQSKEVLHLCQRMQEILTIISPVGD